GPIGAANENRTAGAGALKPAVKDVDTTLVHVQSGAGAPRAGYRLDQLQRRRRAMLAIEEVATGRFRQQLHRQRPSRRNGGLIPVRFRRGLREQLITPERPLRKRSGADTPAGVD